MAADRFEARLQGVDELVEILRGLPAKLRRRAVRNALAAGGRLIRNQAKLGAPVLVKATRYRKPGTVRNAIAVLSNREATKRGDVGVMVVVRAAKAGNRGAKNPNDPFYWRFLEFGTYKMREVPFMRRAAAAKIPEALRTFEKTLGPQIQKLNVNPKDQL